MPRVKTKKVETLTPAPTPTPEVSVTGPTPESSTTPPSLPIKYEKVEALEYSVSVDRGPLTPNDIVDILNWETEEEYQERMVRENPGSRREHWLFGDIYHCLNDAGEKVRCWNNANNRPFDMEWCEELIHTILQFQWAGPLTMPGETINGETIRISKYGRVLSGQHQMTACKIANERLQKSRARTGNNTSLKYPAWDGRDCCVIETLVVVGLSEDERVLRTIDYVKPRTVADMLYTMDVFRSKKNDRGETLDTSPVERREMTRMLSMAVDTLWTRTDTKGYKTHPEVVGFLERHKRLLKCVEHLYILNKPHGTEGRRISKHRLSAGMCSALCYLMGSSGPKTDGDFYRNESPPSEKNLDWSLWDKAKDFWDLFAKDESFIQVREALRQLVDSTPGSEDNLGLGGRLGEKLAILAKAWERWKEYPDEGGEPFDNNDLSEDGLLSLAYTEFDDKGKRLSDGQIKLVDTADFFGIDCPKNIVNDPFRGAPDTPPPSREEIERATREALQRRGVQR